jgi:hypothetical protein
MKEKQIMNIASTNLIIRETKEDAMAKVNAVNNAADNGTDNNTNNHAAVAQSTVTKTDTVELSQKSVELATTTQSDSTTQIAVTKESFRAAKKDAKRQAMQQSQQELRHLTKGLMNAGVSRDEVKSIMKTANRAVNKTIGKEMRQAYNDLLSNKINQQSFEDKLYGAAVKKLDSIVSALRDALAQKVAPNTEAVKETANETKSDEATHATSETRVTSADDAAKANAEKSAEAAKEAANETSEKAEKTTPPGLEKKEEVPPGMVVKEEKEVEKAEKEEGNEKAKIVISSGNGIGKDEGIFGSGPINANEKADNAFGQLVDFFNGIDKIINGFADKVEGKDSNDKDKGDSLVSFASRLNDMFSGINKAFGRQSDEEENVGHKLGMAQIRKETISKLFDNGHGSGAINRIGDAGEGSGNFNAVSFMSSISNGINDALESYREVQKAEEEAKAKEEAKEAVGVLA